MLVNFKKFNVLQHSFSLIFSSLQKPLKTPSGMEVFA